ncbi:hypothetical protein ADK51_18805 [Streptomyces sp. WM6368]|nr:hypothetical protein ADK51_18805 [Streptomyces sp. WM6368]
MPSISEATTGAAGRAAGFFAGAPPVPDLAETPAPDVWSGRPAGMPSGLAPVLSADATEIPSPCT